MAAEDAALDEGVHLRRRRPWTATRCATRPRADDAGFDAIVDAHCEGLRERVRALYARIASVVDEEWEPLNWTQEAAPVEETLESQARRLEEQGQDRSRLRAAHAARRRDGGGGIGGGVGAGPAATNPSSSPHTPRSGRRRRRRRRAPARAPRGVASTMAPPEGGTGTLVGGGRTG